MGACGSFSVRYGLRAQSPSAARSHRVLERRLSVGLRLGDKISHSGAYCEHLFLALFLIQVPILLFFPHSRLSGPLTACGLAR